MSRYDVRATLSDIKPYEASSNSYVNRLDGLSPAEQQAEQLAEEERYYSLYRNEVEEEMYKGLLFYIHNIDIKANKMYFNRGTRKATDVWI